MTALPTTTLFDRFGSTVVIAAMLAALPVAFFSILAQAL